MGMIMYLLKPYEQGKSMNKKEIIEMARKAGVRDDEHIFEFNQYKYLKRFAQLVAEHEREECAKIAEWHKQMAFDIRAREEK